MLVNKLFVERLLQLNSAISNTQGKRKTVRDSGEFEITELDIARLNCMFISTRFLFFIHRHLNLRSYCQQYYRSSFKVRSQKTRKVQKKPNSAGWTQWNKPQLCPEFICCLDFWILLLFGIYQQKMQYVTIIVTWLCSCSLKFTRTFSVWRHSRYNVIM